MNKKTLIKIIASATNITDEHNKLMKIITELKEQGNIADALVLLNSIKDTLDGMQIAMKYFNDKYLVGELKPL